MSWRLLIAAAASCGVLIACGRSPAPAKSPRKAVAATSKTTKATTKATKLPPAATQAQNDETKAYYERRKIKPAVIGGCDEGCRQPAAAVNSLLDSLRPGKGRDKARQLFDWSLLTVNGRRLGDRWAGLWAFRHKRDQRNAEIDLWLKRWLSQFDAVKPDEVDAMRARGVKLTPLPKRTDVLVMRWRVPESLSTIGERQWRVLWTLRGYEWLITRIDTTPSTTPLGEPPRGSAKPGHL